MLLWDAMTCTTMCQLIRVAFKGFEWLQLQQVTCLLPDTSRHWEAHGCDTCKTSSEKSFGCGDVKRMRISGTASATLSKSSANVTAPSRRGLYTELKPCSAMQAQLDHRKSYIAAMVKINAVLKTPLGTGIFLLPLHSVLHSPLFRLLLSECYSCLHRS